MRVKMILPALTEAKSPFCRPIKYSLFPLLGAPTFRRDLIERHARHVTYAGGWKKLEPMWDIIIRAQRATRMLPVLESVLSGFGRYQPDREPAPSAPFRIEHPIVAKASGATTNGTEGGRSKQRPYRAALVGALLATPDPPVATDPPIAPARPVAPARPDPSDPPVAPNPPVAPHRPIAPGTLVAPRRHGLTTSPRPKTSPSSQPVELDVSPAPSAPDDPRPTFIPLALAVDLGQTGPLGSLTTTTVNIAPAPLQPTSPKVVRGPWAPRQVPLADPPAPPVGRPRLTLLPGPANMTSPDS